MNKLRAALCMVTKLMNAELQWNTLQELPFASKVGRLAMI